MANKTETYPPLFSSPRRVPPAGTWEGEVPTDQLWLYLNTVEIAHCHGGAVEPDAWGKLLWISHSPVQGWDVWLECCKLQSCFGENTYTVRVV